MQNVTAAQRTLNIITKAIANGFEYDEHDRMEDIRVAAEEYLIENTEAQEDECEVKSLGNHGQRVDWSDAYGYDYWSQGEIVDFRNHWGDAPETKVFYDTVIDSLGNVIKLYYLVGETDYNAPEGYYYNSKTSKHELLEVAE